LKKYQNAKKILRILLCNKLPDILNDNQKERKIGNLLASLRKNGDIKTDSKDRTSWILKM